MLQKDKARKSYRPSSQPYEWKLEGGPGRVGKGEDPRDATCLAFIALAGLVRTLAGTDTGEVRTEYMRYTVSTPAPASADAYRLTHVDLLIRM